LRWVRYVRVVHSERGVQFYAVGTGHRRPRVVPLSARRAVPLAGVIPFIED
jgi:hypothetical protein